MTALEKLEAARAKAAAEAAEIEAKLRSLKQAEEQATTIEAALAKLRANREATAAQFAGIPAQLESARAELARSLAAVGPRCTSLRGENGPEAGKARTYLSVVNDLETIASVEKDVLAILDAEIARYENDLAAARKALK
jgi:chromosome segregation ATPase